MLSFIKGMKYSAADGLKNYKLMKRFTIKSLGCKVNQCESEAIADALKKSGIEEISPEAPQHLADICIINTCTVTQKASMQSRQAIRQAIRANPKAKIIVTGCYAEIEPEAIKQINDTCSIIGHSKKNKITEIIINGNPAKTAIPEQLCSIQKTRPFLKIQDGCNAFCTYCIVPYARGRSKSMPPEQVLEKIFSLQKNGYHETVLTGIHLGAYGHDLNPATDLYTLLKTIELSKPSCRIRLSSIEPHELTDNIIDLVAKSNIFCRHFHIPLQSGDNFILEKMHRPYTREFFNDLVFKIHKSIPDAAIGVDILAGFPGETDKAFENTYSLIKKLPVTYLHVFPFSPRQGTPAAEYPDQISHAVVKPRTARLRELGVFKKKAFYSSSIGKTVEIIIEGKRTKTDYLKGVSSNYMPVLVNGKDDLKNSIVKVRINKLNDNFVAGNILK